MSKYKKCSFCGNQKQGDFEITESATEFRLICLRCVAFVNSGSRGVVIKKWNTRKASKYVEPKIQSNSRQMLKLLCDIRNFLVDNHCPWSEEALDLYKRVSDKIV